MEKVKTISKKCQLSNEDDSDFRSCSRYSKKLKIEAKVMKKEKNVVVIKEFP